MRVGLNGLFWSQENTGSGQYTRQLWQQLAHNDEIEYTLLGYEAAPDVPLDKQRLVDVPPLVKKAGDNAVKLWWEQVGMPTLARTKPAFDVIHWPYFAASMLQPPVPCATIVTIHDLIPLVLPEYAPSLPLKAYFQLVSQAARQATLILADSDHSRQDILRLLKLPTEKVETVYLGTDKRFVPAVLNPQIRLDLLQKYNLSGQERLIFYIGGFDQRKNMPMLLQAFAKAIPPLKSLEAADKGGNWTLAIAGKAHSANSTMYPDLKAVASRVLGAEDAKRIVFLGRVDEADKAALYQASSMFVFPSIYEGFGLDPLDALACGVPTICSNASSLPELMGKAAMLVSPDQPQAWTDAIVELASSTAKQTELSEAGPSQAVRFTWEQTAERTLQLYNAASCIMTRGKRR